MIDGKHYIGQVAAHMAMDARDQQRPKNMASASFACAAPATPGRLADYMEMAADQGMIGMGAVSVGSATTALYGGMRADHRNQPDGLRHSGARWPARSLLDFATASMSMGEIQKRVREKRRFRKACMLDGHGHPTNDFKTFRGPPRGVFLPFGGYKGSGIALVTEILGGILSGNGLGKHWWDKGGHGVNGVFLASHRRRGIPRARNFFDKVDELIEFVKSTPCAPGFSEILLPGESGRRREAAQRIAGVDIDQGTWNELTQLAAELGVRNVPASFVTKLKNLRCKTKED